MSETGIPQPVRLALAGKTLHAACLTGDAETMCAACYTTLIEAFDSVYGSLPNEGAVLAGILDDLAAEEAERSPHA
jgi:hypothetical protein